MRCSESLSNRVSNIIRGYIDLTKLRSVLLIGLYRLSYSFMFFWVSSLSLCIRFMFRMLFFNSVSYVFFHIRTKHLAIIKDLFIHQLMHQ